MNGQTKEVIQDIFFMLFAATTIYCIILIVSSIEFRNNEKQRQSMNSIEEIKMMREEVSDLDILMNQRGDALIKKLESPYEEVEVISTAYCPKKCCCGKWADGFTSTGTSAYLPGVAVDPKVIPYGTILIIPGYGEVSADDCGGAIKGNKIDVRFKTHQEALNWGKRKLTIKIQKDR